MPEPASSIPAVDKHFGVTADLSSGRIRQFRDTDTTGVIRLRLAKSPGIGSRSSRLIIIGVKPAGVYNLVMPVAYDFCSTQFDDAVRRRAAMPSPRRLRPGFLSSIATPAVSMCWSAAMAEDSRSTGYRAPRPERITKSSAN